MPRRVLAKLFSGKHTKLQFFFFFLKHRYAFFLTENSKQGVCKTKPNQFLRKVMNQRRYASAEPQGTCYIFRQV